MRFAKYNNMNPIDYRHNPEQVDEMFTPRPLEEKMSGWEIFRLTLVIIVVFAILVAIMEVI